MSCMTNGTCQILYIPMLDRETDQGTYFCLITKPDGSSSKAEITVRVLGKICDCNVIVSGYRNLFYDRYWKGMWDRDLGTAKHDEDHLWNARNQNLERELSWIPKCVSQMEISKWPIYFELIGILSCFTKSNSWERQVYHPVANP